jgi:hypothetical protein
MCPANQVERLGLGVDGAAPFGRDRRRIPVETPFFASMDTQNAVP